MNRNIFFYCLTALLFAFAANKANAHTVQVCWVDNGSVTTFYAGTYHNNNTPVGGIIIDGQYSPFSGWVAKNNLPANASCWAAPNYSGCNNASATNPDGLACTGVHHFQTFTSAYAAGFHTLDFSRSTAVEYPWTTFPPQQFGGGACNDADFDGICNVDDACPLDASNDIDGDGLCGDVDNCPLDANPNQTDANGNGQGDACEGVVCGNGLLQGSEQCDDGNLAGGDGCSSVCTIELQDQPPVAHAGADFSVNELSLVTLDGSTSFDPDGDALTFAWTQTAGTPVTLDDATIAQPSFTSPQVALGGETLTFTLTVTANGASHSSSVSVSVVNVNHVPVADAGDNQSVAEGTSVALDGSNSYDADGDVFTYTWVQTGGTPVVTLNGANTANPSFTAPLVDAGGAPGVVATLEFTLTVDDGFPADVAGDGPAFSVVYVEITNINNLPVADAGTDKTINENSAVQLNANGSSDPDGDSLTFSWTQISGTPVTLTGDTTATPGLTTPFVNAGGENLVFEVTVDDGFGGTATDTILVHVQNENDPPNASMARPSVECLWPPRHDLIEVAILGVADPEDNATITIDSVTQDEATNGLGDGDTAVDAFINNDGSVLLRAERAGKGNGRVYHINFTASDIEGSDSGSVEVCVRHSRKADAVDDGELFDSTM